MPIDSNNMNAVEQESRISTTSNSPNVRWQDISAELTTAEVKKLADKYFDSIDKNHDGFLSRNELSTINADEPYGQRLLQDTLRQTRPAIAALVNDEWGRETNISRADITAFDALQRTNKNHPTTRAVQEALARSKRYLDARCHEEPRERLDPSPANLRATDFKALVDKYFSTFDKNNDGFISDRELESSWVVNSNESHERELVRRILRRHSDQLAALSNDNWGPESGITRADIAKFDEMSRSKPDDELVRDITDGLNVEKQRKTMEVFQFLSNLYNRMNDGSILGWTAGEQDLRDLARAPGTSQRERELAAFVADNFTVFRRLHTPTFLGAAIGTENLVDSPGINDKDINVLGDIINRFTPVRTACGGQYILHESPRSGRSNSYISARAREIMRLQFP